MACTYLCYLVQEPNKNDRWSSGFCLRAWLWRVQLFLRCPIPFHRLLGWKKGLNLRWSVLMGMILFMIAIQMLLEWAIGWPDFFKTSN